MFYILYFIINISIFYILLYFIIQCLIYIYIYIEILIFLKFILSLWKDWMEEKIERR